MARKKKDVPLKLISSNEINNNIWIGDREFEQVEYNQIILKPIRDTEGGAKYVDIFRYLLKVLPQDHRDFDIIASLLTYINYQNGLTDRQVHLTKRILDYWRIKGVCNV